MIGIDLFSGAGGMSLGAHIAGIDIRLSVESDKYACETYAHNFPWTTLFSDDIRKLTEISMDLSGRPLILFGGPPCQGFSTSNQRTRTSGNPNNWLFKEFIRVAKMCQPDWIVFENVRGILETDNGVFVELLLHELTDEGYIFNCFLLNSVNFGVPQSRTRFFAIGNKKKFDFDFNSQINNVHVTVDEAIGDLPTLPVGASELLVPYKCPPISEYAKKMRGETPICSNHLVTRNADYILERYKHIPPGGNWEYIPQELMANYKDVSRCHTGIYKRLMPNEPSVVIGNFRKNMLIHPYEHRGLSVREAARLQSFPDWFEFQGSIGFQQQQVGNAVPPLLAKVIFEAIVQKN
jgi:DNA (cytosine-5)-methyltransferase 1